MKKAIHRSDPRTRARVGASIPARSWQFSPTPRMLRTPLIEEITRRDFLVGAGGLLLLAPYGCGSGESEDAESSGETRTIRHALGETEVPVGPERVVVLNTTAFDAAASVGPRPVASVSNLTSAHEEQLEEIETKLDAAEPSLERIAALDPDLILHAGFEGELFSSGSYEQFSEIAPTVVYDFESDAKWKDYFLFFANAIGEEEAAREMLSEYEDRVEGLRERFGSAGQTSVSVLQVTSENIRNFRVDNSFSDSILDGIGFAGTPDVPEEFSLELLPEVGADHIFVHAFGGTEAEDRAVAEALDEVTSSPLWERTPAVREGQAYEVGDYWFGFGLTAANLVLDDLEENLLGDAS